MFWYYGGMQINRTFVVVKQRFNPRNARLAPFVTRLNASRKVAGYKPLSSRYIATLMSHIDTEDLDAFYKKLHQSGNFSAVWWYYCKPKKKTVEKT